jgi:hypothetical protein
MKKLINIKSTKKLMESSIKVGDANYSNRLRKRLVDTSRALELAKEALKKAEQNGQTSLVAQLKARIAELEDLLANYNVDRIQQDTPSGNQGQDSPAKGDRMKQGGQESGSESDEGDEGEENQKDSQNNDPGEESEESGESEGEGEESEESGEGEENQKNNQNKDPEEEGEESESKEGDGEENDPEDEGEGNDSDEDSEEDNQKGKKSDKDENGDGQDPESDDGDKNDEDSDSDDSNEGGGGDPTDRETDDDGADSSSQKSKSSKNKNNDKEDSEDSDDEEDSDDDSDDTSDDTSDDDSESGNSKSKSNSKKQNKSDDSDDEEQESDKSKSKLSLDDDDSNGSGDDDDPILNPFADEEDIPNMPPQGVGGGKFPREATADETIELLKTLKGEGKLGAIDALKELIASRKAAANESLKAKSTKPLTEAVKGLRDMTDDEFGDYINDTYDLIDQADPVTYIDDMDDRAARIKDWSSDPLSIQELQAEDNVELQKDRQRVKARDAAKARYSNYGSLQDFEMNFYSAINNQVEDLRIEYQSYDEINAEYESEDAIMKADIVKELPNEAKPIIEVFFDQSGSWDKRDVLVGRKAIKSIKTFEDMGEIVLTLRFFDDVVTADEDDPRLGQGGTNAWPDILQEIKASGAKNVVIMTDHDMDWDAVRYNQTCRVEGCVWWIWKNGVSAPNCVKHLIGEKGNYQFAFNSSTEDVDDEPVQ